MSAKILIVENDQDTSEVLHEIVTTLGYSSERITDPIKLSELLKINPDLILLDNWLNNGLGSDFCKAIKSNKETTHIPVVMISAVQDLNHIARECGADIYLNKPFELDQLEGIITSYIKTER